MSAGGKNADIPLTTIGGWQRTIAGVPRRRAGITPARATISAPEAPITVKRLFANRPTIFASGSREETVSIVFIEILQALIGWLARLGWQILNVFDLSAADNCGFNVDDFAAKVTREVIIIPVRTSPTFRFAGVRSD
jgi:hypothetical protein